MNGLGAEQRGAGDVAAPDATTRLPDSWLRVARVVWVVAVVPILALAVAGLPIYYQHVQSACAATAAAAANNPACFVAGALPAPELQRLASQGVSASTYAAVLTGFSVLSLAIWCGVGLLIFWRRSNDWLALLAAFVLLGAGGVSTTGGSAYALTLAIPALAWSYNFVSFIGQGALIAFFLLFPNGKLVPRWIWPFLVLGIIYSFFNSFPTTVAPYSGSWPEWLFNVANLLFPAGVVIVAQIYRYVRVSTPLQRQQTKWVVVGVTAAISISIPFYVVAVLNPSIANNAVYDAIWTNTFSVSLLLIPISFGFSIMRYRLYDIDILINRALVYGSLTALLAALYVLGVVGSQTVVGRVTHSSGEQQSPLIIVVTTLVIAALFQPLRRRIQAVIDRRFYRNKYDAARTLATFATTLREEVDLPHLTDHLLGAVDETMQPVHISLWLRTHQA